MKIAYILNDFPSITQTFVLSQINGVIEKGHEVDIYALNKIDLKIIHEEVHRNNLPDHVTYLPNEFGNRVDKLKKIPHSIVKYSTWRRPILFLKLFNKYKYKPALKLYFNALPFFNTGKKKYDIIHCQFATVAPMALQLIQIGLLQGKLITSIRGHDITQDKEIANNDYANLFKYTDAFLPVSSSLKELLLTAGCNERKISILHSGIDCHKFQFKERKLIPGATIKLFSTARLIEMKGLKYAIEAVNILVKKGAKLSYEIIGEGELRNELQAQIAALGIDNHVKLLGWKNHAKVKQKLDSAHIFLAPSVVASNGEKEGIPNALKEAMAQGLPVVATMHSGIPELVDNNISGLLVPEKDSQALADEIEHLCNHPEIWPEMGKAARKKIEEDFDITNLTDELIYIYKKLIKI